MTGGKLKLRKGYRETIEAAREYAEAHGATLTYDLAGGKHPKITLSRRGLSASSSFPSTPRTAEYWNHGRRAARQALRGLEEKELLRDWDYVVAGVEHRYVLGSAAQADRNPGGP